MKKELVIYISTNEEGEEVRVSRVSDGTNQFMLFTLGQNRMVLDVAELMEAVGAIGHYSILFDQEQKIREARKNNPPPATTIYTRTKSVPKEDEGALILEAQNRIGPTASELALEKQTKLMQGESLVLREEK